MTLYDVILAVASKVAGEWIVLALKRRSKQKMQTPELLTEAEVAKILRVHRSTLFRLRKTPSFPKPLNVGEKLVRWTREQINDWIAGKIE